MAYIWTIHVATTLGHVPAASRTRDVRVGARRSAYTGGSGRFPQGLDQVVYKGLVGNVLDAIPMDPSQRVDLQRTNAVVSNTLFGRSLAVLAGLSNPVLLLGGFAWGMWSASNIKPAEAAMQLVTDSGTSGGGAATRERVVALLNRSSAADDAPVNRVPEPVLARPISAEKPNVPAVSPPHVIKIWLPQHSPIHPR